MIASRLRELIGRRYESLHQAALILGLSAIISQVLALVRDRIFAHIFGAGATLDIYYAADPCYQARALQKHKNWYHFTLRCQTFTELETAVFRPEASGLDLRRPALERR